MTTYFVANAGSDGFNGKSLSQPFQTVAHALSVLVAGDTVVLNRGDRFFEAATLGAANLTLDAYGAAPIFDSEEYCTNAPILDQGAAVSGWAAYASGVTAVFASDAFAGVSGTNLTAHTPSVGTSWAVQGNAAGTILLDGAGGTYCTNSNVSNTDYVSPGSSSGNADVFAQATLTFLTARAGDFGGVFAHGFAGTSSNSRYLAFMTTADGTTSTITLQRTVGTTGTNVASVAGPAVVASTPYVIRMEVSKNVVKILVNGTAFITYTDTAPQSWDGTASLLESGVAGILVRNTTAGSPTIGPHMSAFSTGPLDTGSPTNTYQAAVTTQPWVVDHNGTLCVQGNGPNTLADQQWYWYNNVLYFRNDAGTPNGTEIVAGVRASGVIGSGSASGLTVNNIAVEHANGAAYNFNNNAGMLINSCYAQRSSNSANVHGAISIQGTSTNATVQNCVLRDINSDGVYIHSSPHPISVQSSKFLRMGGRFSNGIEYDNAGDVSLKIIRGCVFTFADYVAVSGAGSEKGCLTLFSDNWLVEHNFIYQAPQYGISFVNNNNVARDNAIIRCGAGGSLKYVGITGGGGGLRVTDQSASVIDGNQFYRNLVLDCPAGIHVSSIGTANRTNHLFTNNVVVNLTVAPGVVAIDGTDGGSYLVYLSQSMSGAFQNNLIWNATGSGTGGMLFTGETALNAWTSDSNVWIPDATGEFNWKGSSYNSLNAYKAGSGRDNSSTSAPPYLSNPAYQVPAQPTRSEYAIALAAFGVDATNFLDISNFAKGGGPIDLSNLAKFGKTIDLGSWR